MSDLDYSFIAFFFSGKLIHDSEYIGNISAAEDGPNDIGPSKPALNDGEL